VEQLYSADLDCKAIKLSGTQLQEESTMSVYVLQNLIRDVNRKPEARASYFAAPDEFVAGYDLTAEERDALLRLDIGRLYGLGVHALLLRPFTLLHKVSEPDYLKAIREGASA
jgi:hypothetical protein